MRISLKSCFRTTGSQAFRFTGDCTHNVNKSIALLLIVMVGITSTPVSAAELADAVRPIHWVSAEHRLEDALPAWRNPANEAAASVSDTSVAGPPVLRAGLRQPIAIFNPHPTLMPAVHPAALTQKGLPALHAMQALNASGLAPTQFQLTTAEGYVYTLDQKLGATQVQDPSGNTLTINAGGVTSSTGKSVVFTRDAQNRIVKISDPSGAFLQYQYDAAGNLATVVDRTNQSTTFAYDSNHYLTGITDPRGVQAVKNVYDSTGRLISTTDANGKSITYTHDLADHHETVTDRLGNSTLYEYDDDGNVVRVTDALGNVTSSTYDADDNKLSETNALGKTTQYTYDTMGDQLSVTDPLGHAMRYTYNSSKQVLTVSDALGHSTVNNYDSRGNLLSTKDALGNVTSFTYNSSGQPLTTSDALGHATQFQYDGSGNLAQQTDALNNVSSYTYDANGNKLTQSVVRTRADGSKETLTTQYAYDGSNRLVRTTYPDGSSTQTQYNAIGKQSVTIDQLGHQVSYVYDNDGRLTTTVYPDQSTETVTYDLEGRRLSSTDRGGHATQYAYDAVGRLSKTTYADGSSTSTVYDATGETVSSTDARGNATQYAYDDAGRRASVTDALGHVTAFTYDAAGNQIAVTDANQHKTQFVYDAANRRIQTLYPDQSTDAVFYDALGRQTAKTDQGGKSTQYGYDALGRLSSVTDALGQVTQYGYDELGNRISQADADGHTTAYAYDPLGRRIARTLPLGQKESYSYDAGGNLLAKTDFNGRTTSYAYDVNNRLLSRTPDAFFNAPPVSFTYNALGLRLSMSDASGTTTYSYDNRNRLLAKATPEGTLAYTYDAAGEALSIQSSNANGAAMSYAYDKLGRPSGVTDGSGQTAYGYDAVGNLQSFAYPNGVTTTYSYNALNRLTQVAAATSTSVIASYQYTLGAAGNRLSVAELSGRGVQYGYDDIYRLTSETIACGTAAPGCGPGSVSYGYDAVGNRKQITSTLAAIPSSGTLYYDANDRAATDTYDNDGNTVASVGVSNVYDFENHLVQHGNVSIVYDGDGNRVAETVGGVTTKYLVDTLNPTGYAQVLDELQNGTVVRTYSYGLERISQTQSIGGAKTTSFYGYDGHGSVRQLFSSTGAITDTYDYDAFGNLIASTGSTPNNYLFAGEQFDPAVGLYYNRARYLDVKAGRFWSMDTEEGDPGAPASLHKYLYVGMDSVDRVDPSGHDFDLGSMAVASGLAGTIAGLSVFSYQVYKGAGLGKSAKAGALTFLAVAGITATVYAVVWAGAVAYVGFATGGLTFSLQVYNSFQGGQANLVELEEDLPVVRYYGGQALQIGRYWTTQLFDSSVGAIQELALNPNFGNTADRVVTGVIPRGTQILTGYAAAQGSLLGGGIQIFLEDPNVVRIVSDVATH